MATPQMQSDIRLEQPFADSMDTTKITPPESTHSVQDVLVEDSSSVIDPAAQDGAPEGLVMGDAAATSHPGDIGISQNAANTPTESADHIHEPARGLMSIRRLVQTGRDIVKLPHISAKDLKPVVIDIPRDCMRWSGLINTSAGPRGAPGFTKRSISDFRSCQTPRG
ncbi:hypothetical protein POSPLADRAFT_1034362 [Postia placenta MAD-698-R-SB12]|uniref:Uncharacterized protein n=1 Tax=Postia placenta MAD-698-R-SB12 TaxID=670580 RepID=A0A1X6N097_9APHY|nr:hypothetical protein POSPLADRAFT_1034362 [Postia placenta MAD-698-R-SB12]OSX61863.1 hypothetical protein POSPLADRAFT_1034362 [Postia placenta MAD-698-R-SB12]